MPSVTEEGKTGQIKSLKANEKHIRHSIKYGLESWTGVLEWSLEVDFSNSIYTLITGCFIETLTFCLPHRAAHLLF